MSDPVAGYCPRERGVVSAARGLKDWLAAAPLEGIALPRDRDAGRDVEL